MPYNKALLIMYFNLTVEDLWYEGTAQNPNNINNINNAQVSDEMKNKGKSMETAK
jgi:hypothetical protein